MLLGFPHVYIRWSSFAIDGESAVGALTDESLMPEGIDRPWCRDICILHAMTCYCAYQCLPFLLLTWEVDDGACRKRCESNSTSKRSESCQRPCMYVDLCTLQTVHLLRAAAETYPFN